jgi:hypothetical protein
LDDFEFFAPDFLNKHEAHVKNREKSQIYEMAAPGPGVYSDTNRNEYQKQKINVFEE